MELARRLEEQPVAAHGVVDARAGQGEAVGASEGGDENSARHEVGAGTGKNLLQGSGRDSIFGRVLDSARGNRRAFSLRFLT